MLHKLYAGDTQPSGQEAATVVIHNADEMIPAERKRIAEWLKAQADFLIREGRTFSAEFRGVYLR